MNDVTRVERQLPGILADLGAGRTPDYTDTLLARTAATRQRPGWAFPERWLPMSALTQRMTAAPRIPVRLVAVAALIALVLVSAVLIAGSRQRHVPPPFGPAANGVIPYVSSGEIFVGDPVTGHTRLLVSGLKDPAAPQFSPDGTRLSFYVPTGTEDNAPIDVYVVRDDGSDLRKVTPAPIVNPASPGLAWTPDGRVAVVWSDQAGSSSMDLFDAAGAGAVGHFALAADTDLIDFRPPDGRTFLYRAPSGLYEMDMATGVGHPILLASGPGANDFWGGAAWSADGQRIFYTRPYETALPAGTCCTLWVMNADGTDQHQFIPNDGHAWDGVPRVSPDGKLLAFWSASHVSVTSADGAGPVTKLTPEFSSPVDFLWSPDSSMILMSGGGSGPKASLLDVKGGPTTTVPWTSDLDLGWQRLAAN
jgi:dipeptidyl aminopeptidase/acylaminoacyl peptidase